MRKVRRDHTKLLCDIGELTGLFTAATSLEGFLQKIVDLTAEHMQSDVCSIYLYYGDKDELILKATKGLNPQFVGNIKLKVGEGLTGLAVREHRCVCERHASKNPNFRYFPGLGEEKYESFLAVPILRGQVIIGVMVIQNTQEDYFTEQDEMALRAITSQLANVIEMARLILALEEKHEMKEAPAVKKNLSFIRGKVGSPGFAYCEAILLKEEGRKLKLPVHQRKYTLKDFYHAVEKTEKQLEDLQKKIEEALSDVASLIFTAQILMLKDQSFIGAMVELIHQGMNPPEAVVKMVNTYIKRFERMTDTYLQEKAQDVCDIGERLLENLIGHDDVQEDLSGKIVITRELFPSDILKLSSQNVKGVIILSGGVTGHLSILARSLGIPLVIADEPALMDLPSQTKVLLDAELAVDQGNIYIHPSREILKIFSERNKARRKIKKIQSAIKSETYTKDGTRVVLLANINLLSDVKNAQDYKTEGVGLYRTEFPFIIRNDFPTEEEQFVVYKKLIDRLQGKEATFRTLDIGGDKVLSYFDHHLKEKNPYLGMRSIRFSLKHVEIFSQQIRAILRAAVGAQVRIMFPMISSVDEFFKAKQVVLNCVTDLKREKIVCHESPQIGLMIELPSVMEIIESLAEEADFFSIGTNDFIQYMLAVDRTNEKVADLYLPHHPAVLRALKKVVEAALRFKKDVSICGDMAQEVKYLPYLLGIGIRKFSVNPIYVPAVHMAIRKIDIHQAKKMTTKLLKSNHLEEIERIINAAK